MPLRGMHDHAMRFVQYRQSFVFVQDVQGHVFRFRLRTFAGRLRQLDCDDIARTYAIRRLAAFPIHLGLSRINQLP